MNTLQRFNTENLKQIFLEKELLGHSPNVCEQFIYSNDRSAYSAAGNMWPDPINRSQTHECGNWDWGRAISRNGIHKWNFRCSVWYFLLTSRNEKRDADKQYSSKRMLTTRRNRMRIAQSQKELNACYRRNSILTFIVGGTGHLKPWGTGSGGTLSYNGKGTLIPTKYRILQTLCVI
jgi:hypothetical protein